MTASSYFFASIFLITVCWYACLETVKPFMVVYLMSAISSSTHRLVSNQVTYIRDNNVYFRTKGLSGFRAPQFECQLKCILDHYNYWILSKTNLIPWILRCINIVFNYFGIVQYSITQMLSYLNSSSNFINVCVVRSSIDVY